MCEEDKLVNDKIKEYENMMKKKLDEITNAMKVKEQNINDREEAIRVFKENAKRIQENLRVKSYKEFENEYLNHF